MWAQKIRNKHPKIKSRSAFNFEFVSPSFFRLEATYHLHFAVIVCHLVVRCNVAKLHQANWQYFVAVTQHVAIEVTSKKCIKTNTWQRPAFRSASNCSKHARITHRSRMPAKRASEALFWRLRQNAILL